MDHHFPVLVEILPSSKRDIIKYFNPLGTVDGLFWLVRMTQNCYLLVFGRLINLLSYYHLLKLAVLDTQCIKSTHI